MAYVRPDEAGIGIAYLGIHVGSVHINLSATVVDTLAQVYNVGLEDTMRTGVGNHHGCDLILVGFGLHHKVVPVYITTLVGLYNYGLIAALYGTCRVCPVGRSR